MSVTFIANRLTEPTEADIIDAWINHMDSTRNVWVTDNSVPNVFHWSPAEESFLERNYNAARRRHRNKDWPDLQWYDLLANVAREEPIVVRGSLGFGLKVIVNAMNSQGLTDVQWPDSSIDGLGAMAAAWWCDGEAIKNDVTLADIPLMQDIAAYNEIDCKAMMAIVSYLRKFH